MPPESSPAPRSIWCGAALFAGLVFLISWWHWWTFQYGTFDLAFYVQALWLALRGHWNVSLLNVPLMGNHAEPIVFLLVPFFALCPHPMLLVAVQTVALASMAFTGFRIAQRLGFEPRAAALLGLATLLTPATSSVGIYEFHPEALAAPLLLLAIESRLAEKRGRFWCWFLAVLACKENMALLLTVFCGVFALLDWRKGRRWQWRWNASPGLVALLWLFICARVLSPWLNSGNVDYGQLYAHLGATGGEVAGNFFRHPQKAGGALWHTLTTGNLVWALLLPLLFLPVLRPRWLLIASPLLLQHLLSGRYTEWSLGAHYAAPLVPLFWIAAVEAAARLRWSSAAAVAVAAACTCAHLRFGPARQVAVEIPRLAAELESRRWKAQMLATIPPAASVTAVQPFLSHLARRETLHSLHLILKGRKTLSNQAYEPPPVSDVVAIDYGDATTFNPTAGFYHPRVRVDAEHFVASSDRLLHDFLTGASWRPAACNEVAIYTRGSPVAAWLPTTPAMPFDAQTTLLGMQVQQESPAAMRFRLAWEFAPEREHFPWLMLLLSDGRHLYPFERGACAPEAGAGRYTEEWRMVFPESLPAGRYDLFAVFYEASEAMWHKQLPPGDETYVLKRLGLGAWTLHPGALPDTKPQ